MDVRALTPGFGAEIEGVDVTAIDDAGFAEIYQAWLDYGVICIRGQTLSDEHLQAFSARFGPLEMRPMGRLSEADRKKVRNPYVTVISNIVVDGRPIGGLGNAEAAWHSDMTYEPVPPTASVLFGIELPKTGGDTWFCSQYAAYAALPSALKARVGDLKIKHDASHTSVGELRPGHEKPRSPIEAPGAVHPIVIEHPETGRPALFLGRRDWAYVVGYSLEDSEALLDELWRYAVQPSTVVRHVWRFGDLIVWDNRCCLHRRDDFDPAERRRMHRCQVLARAA